MLTAGTYPLAAAVGDLDGDGRPDLAVADASNKAVLLYSNRGNVQFQQSATLLLNGQPSNVSMTDLDGDGQLDLVAGVGANSPGVDVLLNRGNGKFAPAQHYPTSAATYVAVADLSGDNRADVVAASTRRGGTPIAVLRNTGQGQLADAVNYPSSMAYVGSVSSVGTGHLDGDGRLDIVTSLYSESSPQDVSVLHNQGGTQFAPPRDYPVGQTSRTAAGAAVGDVDGDGLVDIVVADQGEGMLYLMANEGGARFSVGQQLPVPFAAGVMLADLDADGGLDAIVSHEQTITVILSACR